MAFLKRPGLAGSAAGSLVVAMLLFRGGAPNPPRTEPGSKPERPAAVQGNESQRPNAQKKKWPEEGPWKASRQHFAGLQPEDQCPSLKAESETKNVASLSGVDLALRRAGQGKEVQDELRNLWCIPDKTPVRAMIAIVPDPVHSHLSLVFDRTVEALQLSAESMNYVVDRYWLPWQPEVPGSNPPQEAKDNSEKEKQPGLLLFRWNGPAGDSHAKVLYVFLVADTSTAGINGSQFRNAVQYVQQVCGKPGAPAAGCGKGDRIWIMGPTFSGSLASLRALTEPPPSPEKKPAAAAITPYFTAYSGTVSSLCAIHNQGLLDQPSLMENLSRECSPEKKVEAKEQLPSPALAPSPSPTLNLTFRSMLGDTETAVWQFLGALKENGNIQCDKTSQVAIFSEAATTYGGAGIASEQEKNSRGDCKYTSFRYPREISGLRNASASSEPPAAASQQGGTIAGPTYLPFTLADRQPNSADEPPDFSRTQGPLSKEAVLMKYAAELRRGHYKYVGIVGTNVVDRLFLAQFFRHACPDVRLFTVSSDLLFERDQDNAPYIGMLSVSTYPLIGRNLDWTNRQSIPRLPFVDQAEEGQYNASLLVMQAVVPSENAPTLIEVDGPFGAAPGAFDPRSSVLPVWITVVGTGGYWPVQIVPATNDTPSNPQMKSQDFSPAWRAIALFLAGFAFLQSWILWAVKPVGRFHDFALINAAPAQRFFFLNLASASLACTLAIFMAPAWKFGMHADHSVPGIAVVMLLAIVALAVCSFYLWKLLEQIRLAETETRPKANSSYRWSMCFSMMAWLGAVLCAVYWWGQYYEDPSLYGFFFGYRSVNLASGVSPLTPMFLLLFAVFLWSIFEIWRLRFNDEVRPRLNSKIFFPGATTETEIASSINAYFLRPNYLVTFFLVYGAWLFFLQPVHPFQLFEKPTFGWIYEVLFCLVVALMLTNGLRMAQTWAQLSNLLRELERSPIRDSFSRLKGGSWSPIWQAGGQQAEWTNMVRSFEVMQQIKNCDEELDPGLVRDIDAALGKRDEIRNIVRSKSQEISASSPARKKPFARLWDFLSTPFRKISREVTGLRILEKRLTELQGFLAIVLNDIMVDFQGAWEKRQSDLDVSRDPGKDGKAGAAETQKETSDPELQKLHRMEEYVALRYVAFIRGVLGNVRLWLILQAAVFSLVLLSLNVYSFEPHRSLVWSFTAIFAVIGAVAIQVLMQAHRDPVISRITGTQPNELGWQFFVRIATLGAVPLLTLLATHFPSIGRYLLSFFQPGLEAIK